MSPPFAFLTGMVVLVLCGSVWGVSEGLEELTALDVVLRDLQSILEIQPQLNPQVTLTEPLAGVWNTSENERASSADGLRYNSPLR